MKTRVKYEWAGENGLLVETWLGGLSTLQKDELARLDYESVMASEDRETIRAIVKDWIEEHGGERGYWGYFITTGSKE